LYEPIVFARVYDQLLSKFEEIEHGLLEAQLFCQLLDKLSLIAVGLTNGRSRQDLGAFGRAKFAG
jgi:hypothetical protein